MLKTIRIIEKDYHWVRCEYPISLKSTNASDNDFCRNAWKIAIDDGYVNEDRISDYEIEIVEDIPLTKANHKCLL